MKKNVQFLLVIFCCLFFFAHGVAKGQNLLKTKENLSEELAQSYKKSIQTHSLRALAVMENFLNTKNTKASSFYKALLNYYKAEYFLQHKDIQQVENFLSKGIAELSYPETAEDFALLALLESKLIPYASFLKKMSLGIKCKNNIAEAIKKGASIPSVWYVAADINFRTPRRFGGMKYCENYLLKALELYHLKHSRNSSLNFGEQDVYSLLIKYYQITKQYKKAEEYAKRQTKRFSN